MPTQPTPTVDDHERARTHGGFVDRSDWSLLELAGKDAVEFTNNYVTQNLKDLSVGGVLSTPVTSWKGTMVDVVDVLRTEYGLQLLAHPGAGAAVTSALKTFMVNVDVQLTDVSADWGLFYAFGPEAKGAIEAIAGTTLEGDRLWVGTVGDARVRIAPAWPALGAGYHLLVARSDASDIREALDRHGLRPIAAETWDRLRISEGIPGFGHEIGPDVNPWEARLADWVSMSKGCYLGQEVIARLANYDKVQRFLMGLDVPDDHLLPEKAVLTIDAQSVGTVTSSAPGVALGFVKAAHAVAGRRVVVTSPEGTVEATLADRPFWQRMANGGIGARHG